MKERSPKPEALAKQITASGDADGPVRRPRASGGRSWPDACGEFDIRIDRHGTWYYRGSPINRPSLVRLFASVLRRDDQGDYWLVTPAEAGRIEVEDVPFTAVELSIAGSGREQALTMRTNIDQFVTVDAAHPIRVVEDAATGEPAPYVTVRDRLEARILRPVFYELVERGEPAGPVERGEPARAGLPSPRAPRIYGVWSSGRLFRLGTLDADR